MRKEQQEMLARFFHDGTWSHWMKYLYSKSITITDRPVDYTAQPYDEWIRWKRQMNTKYEDLTEREKDSDRNIANDFRKYLTKHGYEVREKKQPFEIRVIDQSDAKLQKHMKQSFEDTLMYLNTIDPNDLPDKMMAELLRLSKRIAEDCW